MDEREIRLACLRLAQEAERLLMLNPVASAESVVTRARTYAAFVTASPEPLSVNGLRDLLAALDAALAECGRAGSANSPGQAAGGLAA